MASGLSALPAACRALVFQLALYLSRQRREQPGRGPSWSVSYLLLREITSTP